MRRIVVKPTFGEVGRAARNVDGIIGREEGTPRAFTLTNAAATAEPLNRNRIGNRNRNREHIFLVGRVPSPGASTPKERRSADRRIGWAPVVAPAS